MPQEIREKPPEPVFRFAEPKDAGEIVRMIKELVQYEKNQMLLSLRLKHSRTKWSLHDLRLSASLLMSAASQ